jgi:DNA-binding transcriptional MerR regulator
MEKTLKKYRIGQFAKIKNIDAQTLRYYDKLGLLTPEIIDANNGYRYYSEKQFIDSDRIKFYKQIGMSLDEIKRFKDLSNMEEVLAVIREKHRVFEEELNRVQIICNNINRIVNSLEQAEHINPETVSIKERDHLYCVGGINKIAYDPINFERELYEITKIYPKYSSIGNNFGIISAYDIALLGGENELKTTEKQLFLRIDQQFSQDENVQKISLGKCVLTYSKRPSLLEEDSIKRLREYVKTNNLIPRDKIYVVPIINRFIIENPEDYLYEVLLPVEV